MKKPIAVGLEIACTFFLVLGQIWFVGKLLSPFTILPLGVITASWIVRKETLRTLGLRVLDFRGYAVLWVFLAGGIALVAVVGVFLNRSALQRGCILLGLPLRFVSYVVPALFQQIILNGYFVNRIQSLTRRRSLTAAVAGLLFCVIHAPNPVLLVLTLFGGMVSAWLFVRRSNVYPLAVAHATLAAFAYCALPQLWHHGFRVGMEYYLFVPKPGDCCVPEFLQGLIRWTP